MSTGFCFGVYVVLVGIREIFYMSVWGGESGFWFFEFFIVRLVCKSWFLVKFKEDYWRLLFEIFS